MFFLEHSVVCIVYNGRRHFTDKTAEDFATKLGRQLGLLPVHSYIFL